MRIATLAVLLAPAVGLAQVRPATSDEVAHIEATIKMTLGLISAKTRAIRIAETTDGMFFCGEMFRLTAPAQTPQFRKFFGGIDLSDGDPAAMIVAIDDDSSDQAMLARKKLKM